MDRRESACVVVLLLAAALSFAGAASADALPFQEGFEFVPTDTHPAGDPFREPEDARTLSVPESERALAGGSLWVATGRGEAKVLAFECTIAGEAHLDSLDTCYE